MLTTNLTLTVNSQLIWGGSYVVTDESDWYARPYYPSKTKADKKRNPFFRLGYLEAAVSRPYKQPWRKAAAQRKLDALLKHMCLRPLQPSDFPA